MVSTIINNQQRLDIKLTLALLIFNHKKDESSRKILYLFRALEITGLYDYTDQYWNVWRKMIKNHMTTSAESNSYCRSECHAWGAVALYELPAIILGVRPAVPGFEKVYIRPVTGYLDYAKGYVITPKGKIEVSWMKKKNEFKLDYKVPEGLQVIL